MSNTIPDLRLTLDGAHKILDAAVTKANEMKLPQCIAIVDGPRLAAAATRRPPHPSPCGTLRP